MLHLVQPAGNVGSFTADDNGRATFQLVSDKVKVIECTVVVNIIINTIHSYSYLCKLQALPNSQTL